PELSSETYLTNVFDAFAVNGKHYIVIPNFDVLTYTAKSPEMDAYKGWNTAQFIEFAKSRTADQQVIEDLTRSQFLNNVMTYRGAEFVDPETGKCNFNSDEFIQLLEYTATLPEEINWDARPETYWNDYDTFYSSGRVALKYAYVSNAHSFYTDNYNAFKGDFTTVGFPTNGGNGACLNCYAYYLIGSNKNHVQQAWDFVRYYLTPEYQNAIEYDIPVLESAYKTWLSKGPEKNSWTDPTTGVTEYYDDYYYVNDQQYEIPTMSQKYLDDLDALVRSTTSTQYQQTDIISIIEEEASALFSGQKSAQDVANVIQSRVQIYVNENQN
ncbi:MAG: extracellular solute-binding protein, partial [Lachnospiraceae bacterium]|nr:extracellular solute-binding protein [Lachnospiraceae bacterium]